MSSTSEKPILVRLKLPKHTVEVLCHANTVKDYKEGKIKNIEKVLVSDKIYKNASRGEVFSKKEIEAAFFDKEKDEPMDEAAILDRIIRTGTAQITVDETREAIVQKRKEIIHYICANFVDPKSGSKIPQTRVEAALDNIKGLTIDDKRAAQVQANELLRKIIDTGLALKKNELEGSVTVPQKSLGGAKGIIQKWCSINGTPDYKSDNVVFKIGLSPGDWDIFMKEMSSATGGDFTFDLPTPSVASSSSGGSGKSGGGGGGNKGNKKKGG
jgi:ribosome maturation protein SDO1